MAMLSPTLEQTFSMMFDSSKGYTWKSQYYQHATLLGSNSVDLIGNEDDNCLGPTSGTNNIDGKSGSDTCMFQGKCSEYSISCSGGSCSITDYLANRDGVRHTSNIDALTFVDGDYDIAAASCTANFSGASTKCWKLLDESNPIGPTPTPPSPTPPASVAPVTPVPATLVPVATPGSRTIQDAIDRIEVALEILEPLA